MFEGFPIKKEVLESDHESREQYEKLKNFALIIIKPMGIEYIQEIIDRLLDHGEIKNLQFLKSTKEQIVQHYSASEFDVKGKKTSYYPALVSYMSKKDIRVFVLEGYNDRADFIKNLRKDVIGPSDPEKTEEGQIRNIAKELEYKKDVLVEGTGETSMAIDNLIHCSDSIESALKEIKIWYNDRVAEKYEKRYSQDKNN